VELSQILYIIAYCTFMAGAARSFRDNGSRLSVWVMSSGVILDFLKSVLPVLGVKALSSNLKGINGVIIFAIAFGFVVWACMSRHLLCAGKETGRCFMRSLRLLKLPGSSILFHFSTGCINSRFINFSTLDSPS
jgi:hypothetical protein